VADDDDEVTKEIVLCAIDTLEQSVAPDNDITAGGIINEDTWTFVLIDASDIEVVAPADYPSGFGTHADVNGQLSANYHH